MLGIMLGLWDRDKIKQYPALFFYPYCIKSHNHKFHFQFHVTSIFMSLTIAQNLKIVSSLSHYIHGQLGLFLFWRSYPNWIRIVDDKNSGDEPSTIRRRSSVLTIGCDSKRSYPLFERFHRSSTNVDIPLNRRFFQVSVTCLEKNVDDRIHFSIYFA